MRKIIPILNIAFFIYLMSKTSYGWYVFQDFVFIGMNAYLLFNDKK